MLAEKGSVQNASHLTITRRSFYHFEHFTMVFRDSISQAGLDSEVDSWKGISSHFLVPLCSVFHLEILPFVVKSFSATAHFKMGVS